MNQKEWKISERYKDKFKWYNKTRKIQKSLQYNSDPNAKIIHHLRDTDEQRKYNDNHYELWGFEIDENGSEHFEYGKYVVFVTEEWHNNYHSQSDETKRKNSESVKASMTEDVRKRISESLTGDKNPMYGKRGELAPCYGRCGELHPMYGKQSAFKGKHHTEESKKLLSDAHKDKTVSEEVKKKISDSIKTKAKDIEYINKLKEAAAKSWTDERRRATSDERKARLGLISCYYKEYKSTEATNRLDWPRFVHCFHTYKQISHEFDITEFIAWVRNTAP
jgi:hypothetical protein